MTDHIVDGCGDHVSALDAEPQAIEPIMDDGENVMQGVEEYFYELLIDMDMVSRIRRTNPTQIQAGQMVLSREILRVWDLMYSHRFLQLHSDENRLQNEERP